MANTVELITTMEFADRFFGSAKSLGYTVRTNKNLERQVDFEKKYLTEDDLRRLYRDIVRKNTVYARADMEALLMGNRPCAVAPFFKVACAAGLCEAESVDGKKTYRFKLAVGADVVNEELLGR